MLVWNLKEKKYLGKTELVLGEKEVDDSLIIKNLFCFSGDCKKLFVRSDDKKGIKAIKISDFSVLTDKICDNIISKLVLSFENEKILIS